MSLVLSGLLGANLVQDGVVSESKLSTQALETSSPQRIWCSNPVPTTSGLTAPKTGLPSWARKLTLALNAVSLSSTSPLYVQLGTSAGFVVSGYSCGSTRLNGATATTGSSSTGAAFLTNAGTLVVSGTVTLVLVGSNIWSLSGTVADGAGTILTLAALVTLPGVLDRIQLAGNGADTFDGGSYTVIAEG